ncbi:MAG TPA: SusC/RagA family TonB-linked outer membrane protein [Chitinophagaceae bacterium]|nr:SusC/RagA family TonB-linked outer membrane protein [Chitinophagaceae bacterium]
MTFKRLLMTLVLPMALLASLPAAAQNKVISGKVTDAKDGSPLAGVTVLAKGTKIGTQTDIAGAFSINAPAGTTTLVISYVGFTTQEVPVGTGAISVSLVQTSASLNDVVVVAYGTRKKGDLTGAVTSISEKDFQKGNITSAEQLLQGKVAGLQVTTGGGSAGGGSRIRIRGGASLNASNDPLIVIDGVPVESNGIAGSANYLNTINPNDIESETILKDASATALYGSRASNGVIIITTKKGAKGKVKFNFNTQPSLSVIDNYVPVLTADQIRTIITNDAAATGNNTYKNLLGSSNTDWQKVIFRNAFSLDNNLSASGSIGKIPFRISGGYLNEQGTLKTNTFDRYSAALNLTPKFFDDHLSINLNVKASQTNNRFADEGAIGAAVSFDPTQPVYAKNNYGGYFEWLQADGRAIDLATRNPLGLLEQRDNTSKVQRVIGNIQVDYKLHFFPDLHVQVNLGIDKAGGSGNDNIDSLSATNYKTAGHFTYYKQGKTNTLADVSLFYTKDIKSIDSKIDVLALHSYEDFYTDVYNYPAYGQNGVLIPGSTPTYATDKPEYRIESYLGRMNFTFHNKYLLTASIRSDASSKFSPDTRVGYFPAGAFAWKLKEEFFKTSRVISDLKLRLGYGVTGQQDIGDYYGYLAHYSQSNSTAQYLFGSTYYSFYRPSAYDANRKWESTTTYNAGVDFSLFGNRLSGSVDVYDKKTKDLLSVIPIAPGSNFDITLLTNVGNMENKGVEVTINSTPVKSPDVTWDLGFNVTYNESKITNLLKNPDPNFKGVDVSPVGGGLSNYVGKFIVGYAPYTFYVYKQVYDAKTGKPLDGVFEDLNRDGKIDDADRYLYKKPAPDVLLGFTTNVTYKNWSLGLSGHGSIGNYIYDQYNSNNGVLRALKNPLNFVQNASPDYLNTGFSGSSINEYLSDYYIQNASFVRLDYVSLGYNAGKVFHNGASLRLLATVQNVFVITKYKGLDPENANDAGTLYTIYPRPRIYALGVNLDF